MRVVLNIATIFFIVAFAVLELYSSYLGEGWHTNDQYMALWVLALARDIGLWVMSFLFIVSAISDFPNGPAWQARLRIAMSLALPLVTIASLAYMNHQALELKANLHALVSQPPAPDAETLASAQETQSALTRRSVGAVRGMWVFAGVLVMGVMVGLWRRRKFGAANLNPNHSLKLDGPVGPPT